MKTKYTLIIAAALVASALTGCKSTQAFTSNNSSARPINFNGMGNKNTCDINNSTKAERKYLAYYDYCKGLQKSYTNNSKPEIDNNAVGAGAAYMLLTGGK